MPKQNKSPQEKKRLELTKDHFTFAEYPHAFRKTWKRKKVRVNREKRRKSEQLLSNVRPGISSEVAEERAGEVTTKRLGLVSRKRLRKSGTVTLGEKVRTKLEARELSAGKNVARRREEDALVISAVNTLTTLESDRLVGVVNRIRLLLDGGDPVEWMRVSRSSDPLDRAVFLVEQLNRGSGFYLDAFRRNPEACELFHQWKEKADRLLARFHGRAQLKTNRKSTKESSNADPRGIES